MSSRERRQKKIKKAIERFEGKENQQLGHFSVGRFCSQILAVVLILNLNGPGLFSVSQALAYFTDQEMASEIFLTAGILDFSLTNQNIKGFIGVELGEDREFSSVITKTSGGLAIQYKARAEKISGNDDFCNVLKLEAFHSAVFYDGALLSFNTASTTALGAWAFELKLPHTVSNFSHGQECNVDLVFEGWPDDVADFNQSGFNDQERIQLRLTSRMVVLNEFLPNPEGQEYGFDFGDDSSDMPRGEWVELYNNSDISFDLAGWYIRDASATNKILITSANTAPAGTVINGKSWLVVYMNKAVLNNDGDIVKLFDSADNLVDSYVYTTTNDYCDIEPTPGDENSTETLGACPGVPPNKSYARIPDGIGYWADPFPTPGAANLLENESFVFSPAIPEIEEKAPEVANVDVVMVATSTDITATIIDDVIATSTEMVATSTLVVETTEEPVEEEPPANEEPVAEEPVSAEDSAIVEEPIIIPDNTVAIISGDGNSTSTDDNL